MIEPIAMCSHRVFKGLRYEGCGKTAKVTRDGAHYCGIHDPERVAARDAKAEIRRRAKDAVHTAAWELQKAERAVLEAILKPWPEDSMLPFDILAVSAERRRLLRAHEKHAEAVQAFDALEAKKP